MKGFTLLETMVAIALIMVGLISSLMLISTSLMYVSNVKNRLIAANLVAEGIELTRNIRDNNWLQNQQWNGGLADGNYQIAYNSALSPVSPGSESPLLIDADGFYNYSSGETSSFTRSISIVNLSVYEIRIVSTVYWSGKGINYNSSAESHLFDWK